MKKSQMRDIYDMRILKETEKAIMIINPEYTNGECYGFYQATRKTIWLPKSQIKLSKDNKSVEEIADWLVGRLHISNA